MNKRITALFMTLFMMFVMSGCNLGGSDGRDYYYGVMEFQKDGRATSIGQHIGIIYEKKSQCEVYMKTLKTNKPSNYFACRTTGSAGIF